MRVLSLFDGMSCGMIAMQAAGAEIKRYVAYEIDKYAKIASAHNFPMIEQQNDVFDANFNDYEGFDFLIGGSPCTYWSIAQHPDKRETVSSGLGWDLFSQYIRAIKEAKPKYFIYENNKSMSKDMRKAIDNAFGFDAILINSALVSAQNRNRLYWVGMRCEDGTYKKVDISQPKDKGILLKDILGDAECVCVGTPNGKSYTLKAQYAKNSAQNAVIGGQTYSATMCAKRIGDLPNNQGIISGSQATRIYDIDAKSVNLVANGGGQGAKTGLYAVPICVNSNSGDRNGKRSQPSRSDRLYSIYGKGTFVTTGFNSSIIIPIADNTIKEKVYRVENGIITIDIKGEPRQYPVKLDDGYYIIRKLSVAECKRLQTVPEWYDFSVVSDTQAYKMLGNGWTCDVITHLINFCL